MQTFSNMRRNSTHQNYLRLFSFCLTLLLGQIMSSLYPLIPTFVGVVFCYLILEFHKREEHALPLMLSLAYLLFYDLNKGFYLFSYIILFAVVYKFAIYKMQHMISCNNCILAIYVSIAYLGHYILNCFLAYLANESLPYFSDYYFYYIGVDSLIAFMLFKVER